MVILESDLRRKIIVSHLDAVQFGLLYDICSPSLSALVEEKDYLV